MENDGPLVSFVLPVKNEEQNLPDVLRSIDAQSYRSYEVVVVDNGSVDETLRQADEFACRTLRSGGTISDARRAGVGIARGRVFFFVDADQVLAADCLEKCVATLDEPGAQAVIVPERAYEPRSTFQRLLSAERQLSEAAGGGIPRVFRRERYLSLGGHLPGVHFREDAIVKFRYPEREIRIAGDARIYHKELPNLTALLRKYYAYGAKHIGDVATGPITSYRARRFAVETLRLAARRPLTAAGVAAIKAAKLSAFRLGALVAGTALQKQR